MSFPRLQNPLDWSTQAWNIVMGKPVDQAEDQWLLGPIGKIGDKADDFISRVAKAENLQIIRDKPGAGLMESFADLGVNINPQVEAFYQNTSNYDLNVRTEWTPGFGSMGFLVRKIFSERIQQLNLPQNSQDSGQGVLSEIIYLENSNDQVVYRVWRRHIADTNDVVFYGIYTHCQIPSGEQCLKVIFPLPEGSATVIFSINSDKDGNLELLSSGNTYGDPGFYFLVKDNQDRLWKHYLSSFRERLFVFQGEADEIEADHSMSLWNQQAYKMHYLIEPTNNAK